MMSLSRRGAAKRFAWTAQRIEELAAARWSAVAL